MKGFDDAHNSDIESNADLEGFDASIDASNLGFLFDITSKQMYRDPIGSIVREITSNCFDAHIEAGVDEPVVIEFGEDDGGEFIAFKDVGIGISPERFRKTYANYFSSTKRDSNNQIGFFGLGSKSPFSYTDIFYLNTIYNGIKYEYVIHKGERAPRFDKMLEYATTERNGTEVKIHFHKTSDRMAFVKAISTQLKYFDDVFVKGVDFNNIYQIIEGENFKLRSDVNPSTPMHVCIGKVYYPIDSSQFFDYGGIDLNFPIALKFDIGDLPITPERESLRYVTFTKDGIEYNTAQLIIQKREAAQKEIQGLEDERELEKYNNLHDYEEAKKTRVTLNIGGVEIPPLNFINTHAPIYEPFENIPILSSIVVNDNYPFICLWGILIEIHKHSKKALDFSDRSSLPYIDARSISNTLFVRVNDRNTKYSRVKKAYLYWLMDQEGKNSIAFVLKRKIKGGAIYRDFKRYFKLGQHLDYSKYNFLKLWKYFCSVMHREFITMSIDYDTLVINPEWLANYTLQNKKTRTTQQEGSVLIDDMRVLGPCNIPINELQQSSDGFIIYGFQEDIPQMKILAEMFQNGIFSPYKYRIYRIRQRDEKVFIKLKNAFEFKMFMSDNPVFRKVATSCAAYMCKANRYRFIRNRKTHKDLSDDKHNEYTDNNAFSLIFPPLGKALNTIRDRSEEMQMVPSRSSVHEFTSFMKETVEIGKKLDLIDKDILLEIQRVESYLSGLEIINYIELSFESLPLIAELFYKFGKRVAPEWKDGFEPWQIRLIEESFDKMNYYESLNDSAYVDYTIRRKHQILKDKFEPSIEFFKSIINYDQKTRKLQARSN